MTKTTIDKRRWIDLGAVAAPWAGLALALAAIAVADRGTGTRPALALLLLALGVAAGLCPLRYGLPVGVVLAGFAGFDLDFVGWHASYWNELFVGGVVIRGVLVRRPSRRELAVAAVVAAVLLGYLATGTSLRSDFWGAKILLLSVLAGWGIWRQRPGRSEWLATYYGLATLVAASTVLAVWQRHEGAAKLRALGLSEDRLRTTEGGILRIFAGFTSASPFAYALAIASLCWLAAFLSPTDRRMALATIWVPVAAGVGIAWASNRLALLMVLGTLAVVALTAALRQARASLALVGAAGVLAAVLISVVGGGVLSSRSAAFRTELWRGYLAAFTPGGAGPAASGSAYLHVPHLPYHPPLLFGRDWPENFVVRGVLYRGMGTDATLAVGGGEGDARPPLTLIASAGSIFKTRTLTITLRGRRLGTFGVPAGSFRPLMVRVPRGEGTAALVLHVVPPAQPVSGAGSTAISIRLESARVVGVPEPRDVTLRVYHDVWVGTTDPENHLGGIGPGVVDNQYVSWLFSYGVLGVVLILLWAGALLAPLALRGDPGSLGLAAAFCGCFVALAGLAVNIWEEAPTDLLAAIVIALAYGGLHRGARPTMRAGAHAKIDPSANIAP